MLEGDLATTGVATTLARLGAEGATGCLRITDADGKSGLVHLRDGRVYSVTVPGLRPSLGPRLVSSGALGPGALEEALEAQRTELQGWRLSELLVHLGYVNPSVLESFVVEQVREAAGELLQWTAGRWRFRAGERTRDDVAPPTEVADLLQEMQAREEAWATIRDVVPGPAAVPRLGAGSAAAPEQVLDSEAWSLLCKVDGERTVARLARECGFTLFEAGRVTCTLAQAGLLEVSAPEPEPSRDPDADGAQADPTGSNAEPTASLEPVHLLGSADSDAPGIETLLSSGAGQPRELWSAPSEDALEQVSLALSSLLGTPEPAEELLAASPSPYEELAALNATAPTEVEPVPAPAPPTQDTPAPQAPVAGPGADTDTAALLRELSSLGCGSETGPAPAPRAPAARPVAAAADRKGRRKGLFGRG